jgi:linoleoyl-CoA desaturase
LKDKHKHIEEDSELLKRIYSKVANDLPMNKRNDRVFLWLKFLFYFSFSLVSYILLYLISNSLLFIFCYIIYGFSALLLAFNFAHDLSHNTVFGNKKLNNLGFIIIYSLVGAHAEAWKKRHIHSHHYAPNVENYDSDLKISSIIRVIPDSKYLWYHRFQHYYAPFAYSTYSLFWVFIKDFIILFSKEDPATNKGIKYHLSFWTQKIFNITYLIVMPILFSSQPWYIVLMGFLLMHLLQSIFLLFTFFMTHHVENTEYPTTDKEGHINTSWLMNQIRSSNDMHPFSSFANFILGGFNNHIAHHLFPHIHHIHYPRLSSILYKILLENGIEPNQTTYWGGILSHLRLLKKMSINPSDKQPAPPIFGHT